MFTAKNNPTLFFFSKRNVGEGLKLLKLGPTTRSVEILTRSSPAAGVVQSDALAHVVARRFLLLVRCEMDEVMNKKSNLEQLMF